jgi:hypothetical protein
MFHPTTLKIFLDTLLYRNKMLYIYLSSKKHKVLVVAPMITTGFRTDNIAYLLPSQ